MIGAHRPHHRLLAGRRPFLLDFLHHKQSNVLESNCYCSGYLPLIIYLGYTRSNPRPSLIRSVLHPRLHWTGRDERLMGLQIVLSACTMILAANPMAPKTRVRYLGETAGSAYQGHGDSIARRMGGLETVSGREGYGSMSRTQCSFTLLSARHCTLLLEQIFRCVRRTSSH